MKPQEYRTIKVSRSHYDKLAELGTVRDSFDKVIGRLLENNKKEVAVAEC